MSSERQVRISTALPLWTTSPALSQRRSCSLSGPSTGGCLPKLYITLILLALLPGFSFGQQGSNSDLATLLSAAQKAQAANDFASAASDYQQAVTLRPDIPELRADLGLMQHESGDYARAIQSFRQALRLKPSLYVPNLFLGIDYVQTGKAREAIPFLLKAEKMNASDPLPALTLGRAWSSLGDNAAAIRAYQHVLAINPQESSAWFDLGIAQLNEVEAEARTMTAQFSRSGYAKALFAESLVKQSRYKEAASLYLSILASRDQPPCMQSEAAFVDLKLGDTREAASQFNSQRTRDPECLVAMLGQAQLKIIAGANSDALNLVRQIWNRDHGFFIANASVLLDSVVPQGRIHNFLDYVAQQNSVGLIGPGLFATISQLLQPAFNRPPVSVAAISSPSAAVAQSKARQEYLEGHYAHCASLLYDSLDSHNAAALEMLATCSWFTGDYNLTYEAAHELKRLPSPSLAEALYWSIKANERLAFESLARFNQLDPNSVRTHILLGDIYRQRRQYSDAQKAYKTALAASPANIGALFGLAETYYDTGDTGLAIRTAQNALQENPEDPEINLVMGEALVSQRNFDTAKPYLLKALKARQQVLPSVHALLGEVYAQDGKTQEAIQELKLGESSDQDGSLHYRLARLYNKIGDHADAAEAIRQTQVLEQKQRENAVIAIEGAHSP